MKSDSYDIIIIGGGIMGSATAYYLMHADNRLNVLVIERDPTYAKASTTLSMTNARIQFSLKQNVQISQYAFDILDTFEEDMTVDGQNPVISYRREGNLFLFDENGQDAARKAFNLQKSLDCPIEWWPTDRIRERFPLYDTNGYAGATFGPFDGHFDAYAVLMAYKKKARALGAQYLDGEATEIENIKGRVERVKL
ncbi:MAG: FAD-binding oxidoreductase, partial [Deltaproteobacteria bacterium]|nr:FAD-binding oxidoreductase [Deltaproteobacteria bacterium]